MNIKKINKVGEIGPIPYDVRKPTMERFMSRVWNPNAPYHPPVKMAKRSGQT